MGARRGVLWLVVGGYIAYLGVSLIKGVVAPDPGAEKADNPVLFMIIGIAFLAIAAFFVVCAIRNFRKKPEDEVAETEEEDDDDDDDDDDDEEEVIETAPASDGSEPMSIADRIKYLSRNDEEEEETAQIPAQEQADSQEQTEEPENKEKTE